jgi:glycosyltransferase involved in cell wall biosynthesis
MSRRAAFVVPGGLEAITGGNIYDLAVIDALRRRGWDVDVVEPETGPLGRDVTVVDSLALRRRRPGYSGVTVALLHQIPSEAEGHPEWEAAEREALGRADLIVAVGEGVARSAARMSTAPVVVIPPGRDRAWAADPGAVRDIVLCVANAHPGKGLPDAVSAYGAAGLEELTLALVGDPDRDPHESQLLRKSIAGAPGSVRLAGVVPPEELSGLYARTSVFLTASRYEGWPIAVAEAMASGIPVVGFDVPGVAELVRDGVEGLLVPPGDIASLAEAMRRVVQDPALRDRLGEQGRGRARSWPTWEQTGERFADVMEELATRPRRQVAGANGAR